MQDGVYVKMDVPPPAGVYVWVEDPNNPGYGGDYKDNVYEKDKIIWRKFVIIDGKEKREVDFFSKLLNLAFKSFKVIFVSLIVVLLLPKILLSYISILYTIIISPPSYDEKASKAKAFHESLSWIKELYQQFIGEKITVSNYVKLLIQGIAHTIGLILVISFILNLFISGYYLLNRESILQKNIQLGQETVKLKKQFGDYGKAHDAGNTTINNYDRKINKTEQFLFEYPIESKKVEVLCFEIMKKNDFNFANEINKDKIKVLVFEKEDFICEIHFSENKEVSLILRRRDYFRGSEWYDILSSIILITSSLDPLRRFEVFNYSW